jgi:hypothetical protein
MNGLKGEFLIFTLPLLLILFLWVKYYLKVKKHYYMSYDGVLEIAFIHSTKKNKEKIHTEAKLSVSEHLYLDVEYFVGFVKIFIWQKEDGKWNNVETINEDIWNKNNSLFKIKGPWKDEINKYFKKEYNEKNKDSILLLQNV